MVTVGDGPGVAVSVGVGVLVGVAVFAGKVAAIVGVKVGLGVFKTIGVGVSGGGSGVLVGGISLATVGSDVAVDSTGSSFTVGVIVGTTATETRVGVASPPVPKKSDKKDRKDKFGTSFN